MSLLMMHGKERDNKVEPFTSDGPPTSLAQWTLEEPTLPGAYWLRHGVFLHKVGAWHELQPILVEVAPDCRGRLHVHVPEAEKAWALNEVIVAEWAGPLRPPA
jgi:hypothetical protein